jgi:hypothetical protein
MLRSNAAFLLIAVSSFMLAVADVRSAAAQLTPIDTSGTVVAISPQTVSIRTDMGTVLIGLIDPIRIDENVVYSGIPEPQLQVNGVESADFLKPGMFVRFEAEVENQRTVKGDISQVTVFTQTKDTVLGLLPNAIGGAAEKPAAGNDGDSSAVEQYLIAGRVTFASRGSITIALPDNKTIKVRLTPDAVVNIAASDIRLVRAGDRIHAQGFALRPPKFFATNVTVTRVDEEEAKRQARRIPNPVAAKDDKPAANVDPFKIGGPSDNKPDQPAQPKQPGRILKVN